MEQNNTLFKKIEFYGALVTLALLIYRVVFGTGLNGLLITALVVMAIYYMWFGFFIFSGRSLRDLATPQSRKRISPFRIASSILMGLVYSFCTIAILYAVFFYEAMNFMLAFAFFLSLLATGFTLVYHKLNPEDGPYLRQFYQRSAILGLLCLAMWITPVNTRLKVLFRQHPDYIEAYQNYRANPDDEQAEEALRKARSFFR
ncbi:MAG: hypothetical protein V2I46_02160 [Bacteroides sp.]|jgi:hypothetical protein|nr:hypothetical protein [Bacteroides sp.]